MVCIFVFLIFVSIGLICLNFHDPLIDWELLKYGNIAVAISDGIVPQISLIDIRIYAREGSEILLEPLVALFYSLFGENYYTLQKMAVFLNGFWAVVWFLVACQLFKEKKVWLALIFILAIPLIHLQQSPLAYLYTHLGVSLFFGLSLLFLLKAQGLENREKKFYLLVSGFIYSIALFHGFTALLLLPAILILFFKPSLRLPGFLFWTVGFFIAFIFYFPNHDWGFLGQALVATTGRADFGFRAAGGLQLQTTLSTFASLLIYFGGILKNDALNITNMGNPDSIFSLLSGFYLIFLMIVLVYHFIDRFLKERWALLRLKNISLEFWAFLVSSIFLLLAVAHLRCSYSLKHFDGQRYLIPVIPFYLLALSYFLIKNYNKAFIKALFLIYFGFTIFALFSFIYPFKESNKELYQQTSGFDAIYLLHKPELATKINLENTADDRLGRYTFMMGKAYAELPYDFYERKKELEKQLSAKPATVKQHALDEFVRGYYSQKD